ncbi:unnamed protein product [Macrosiphum euphorbiae]|uniref:Uncharacterized protein n=1 Tax=Macrosiphum euphorbiae TaxID=13131 RepID=A0AAV0VUV0_9HEMI|nr:unnamed protein product [Macrosiphum euphorbiae]
MLDGLAFLRIDDVIKGLEFLKSVIPDEGTDLVKYFETTYVNGCPKILGKNKRIIVKNVPAPFPPSVWNVHLTTLNDNNRTNNQTEGWDHRFSKLFNQTHPFIWHLIEKMRLEVVVDSTHLLQRELGQPPPKKLKILTAEYHNGDRTINNFLHAISNVIIHLK